MTLRALAFSLVVVVSACGNGGTGNTGGGQGGGHNNTGGGSGGTSTLTLAWNFDGRTCAQQATWAADAGIPAVVTLTVELNGQTLPATGGFDCADNGVVLTGLAEGAAAYTVHAWSAEHEELFRGAGTTTISGATNSTVTLTALKGGLAFTWYFWNGANYVDCADAGVTNLTVNLKRAMSNDFVFGDAGTVLACPTPFGDGLQLPWLAPGRYFIYLEARDSTNARYATDPISPPRADVDAGVFPRVEDVLQPAELYRQ